VVRAAAITPEPVAGLPAGAGSAAKHAPADVPVPLPTSARLRKHTPTGRTRPQRARLLCLRKFRLDARNRNYADSRAASATVSCRQP
jgi:hypothetical protein